MPARTAGEDVGPGQVRVELGSGEPRGQTRPGEDADRFAQDQAEDHAERFGPGEDFAQYGQGDADSGGEQGEQGDGDTGRDGPQQMLGALADLGRDDLSWAQREALHDRLDQNVRQAYEKDSESKQFLGAGMKTVAAALGLGAVFVGGKLAGASEDGSEETQ
jgi:hypothetical protein